MESLKENNIDYLKISNNDLEISKYVNRYNAIAFKFIGSYTLIIKKIYSDRQTVRPQNIVKPGTKYNYTAPKFIKFESELLQQIKYQFENLPYTVADNGHVNFEFENKKKSYNFSFYGTIISSLVIFSISKISFSAAKFFNSSSSKSDNEASLTSTTSSFSSGKQPFLTK